MTSVLIVEDDTAIRRGLADNLEHEGYEAIPVGDAEEALEVIAREGPDLILLDLMLPGMSGFEFCSRMRDQGDQTPIIVVSARSEEADRIRGLDLGADDYITKPFSIQELMARVRAALRRSPLSSHHRVRFDDIIIDFKRYEVIRGEELVPMTRKEFGVLQVLIERGGEVVTRDELLDEVWGIDAFPTTRTVDNHIATIRSKLEPDPSEPRYILTVHGVGYRWFEDLSP